MFSPTLVVDAQLLARTRRRELEEAARALAAEREAFLARLAGRTPSTPEERAAWADLGRRREALEVELARLNPPPGHPVRPGHAAPDGQVAQLRALWVQLRAEPHSKACGFCTSTYPKARRRRGAVAQLEAEVAGFCSPWCQEVAAAEARARKGGVAHA